MNWKSSLTPCALRYKYQIQSPNIEAATHVCYWHEAEVYFPIFIVAKLPVENDSNWDTSDIYFYSPVGFPMPAYCDTSSRNTYGRMPPCR